MQVRLHPLKFSSSFLKQSLIKVFIISCKEETKETKATPRAPPSILFCPYAGLYVFCVFSSQGGGYQVYSHPLTRSK